MAISFNTSTVDTLVHDLSTPLSIIKMNIDSLKTSPRNKNIGGFISRIEKGVDEMDQMLAFKSNVKRPIVFRTTAVKEIRKVVAMYQNLLSIYKIKIQLDFKEDYFLEGNEDKFVRIINNFITNAIDALRDVPRFRKITVSTYRNSQGFVMVFRDNGIGISKQNLTKIFSYGFTTKRAGNGIGLYNIKELLLKYFNGMVICHSREFVGTFFEVIIPD